MSPMFVLGCCIRRAEAQTFDGERYLVQSNASLPTSGVAKEDGIAPLQSPCVDGQSVHGSEIPTTNDWISLFLHLACMCMRAYTPTAKAATHLLIWNRHGPKWYFALLTRHGEDQFAKCYHHRLTAERTGNLGIGTELFPPTKEPACHDSRLIVCFARETWH